MNVTIIGLGLIGGSLARAAQRAGHVVRAVTRTPPPDAPFPVCASADGAQFVAAADVVLIALPPAAVVPWVESHADVFKDGAIVVDATGVKGSICEALRKYALQDRWTFIGGHPMAGKEVSGFANSTADLFKGASMILTPYPSCGRKPIDLLEKFFAELGFGRVVITTPEHHDRMIALTSQLAHVVSSAYVRDPLAQEHAGYSAGSFHDMTRVARLDPDIWTDLFLANRQALVETLDGLVGRLAEFRSAIGSGDADTLRTLLTKGRMARLAASGGRKLVVATHNKNKIREIGEILPGWEIVAEDSGAEETADTFAGNALIKARAIAPLHAGAWVMADDSGLEVVALGGEPGVRSARYAGRDGDTPANNALLLKNLSGVADRRAQFTCAIALIAPDGTEHVVTGHCPGSIRTKAAGAGGFGYDPLFEPDGFDRTFAELASEEKNSISHRGRALAEARRILEA